MRVESRRKDDSEDTIVGVRVGSASPGKYWWNWGPVLAQEPGTMEKVNQRPKEKLEDHGAECRDPTKEYCIWCRNTSEIWGRTSIES